MCNRFNYIFVRIVGISSQHPLRPCWTTPKMVKALLVMDIQNGIVGRYPVEAITLLFANLNAALEVARASGLVVLFVRVAFREGAPEVSLNNKSFSATIASSPPDVFGESAPATQIHDEMKRQPNELLITKRRVGAFTGSDLDVVLRAKNVDELILSGISTSGVVLSTVRAAADMDYKITVLRDGCVDMDEEVHRVLMDKVFARQCSVINVAEWVEQVKKSPLDSPRSAK